MITKLNHVSIFVLDQDSAYDFYVNKLGFNVHTDAPMGPGMRWLTVTSPEQPDLEMALMAMPSHSSWITFARSALLSLFMLSTI